jgi:hypothetical protein
MADRDKLFCLFDTLNEKDKKAAFEFIKSLAHPEGEKLQREEVIQIHGKNYFVVPD